MFKKLAISLGLVAVTTLVVYTVREHKLNQQLTEAVNELANNVAQYVIDVEFAEIVEGLRDIDT